MSRIPHADRSTAGRFIQHVARVARMVVGQNRPGPTTTNSRRAQATTRLLPHTLQLCIHCRHNPAGFWVRSTSGQTVRRPWCLSCCQYLEPGRYHLRPFDS
jgi:hypothetical protein